MAKSKLRKRKSGKVARRAINETKTLGSYEQAHFFQLMLNERLNGDIESAQLTQQTVLKLYRLGVSSGWSYAQ